MLPKLKNATDVAANDFKETVMPNVQKLTRSVVDWGKRVGENGSKMGPGMKNFGMNVAQSWSTKVQPVIDAWM